MADLNRLTIRNRLETIRRLCTVATNSIADDYEIQHHLEKIISANAELFGCYKQEQLGFVGDVRKFRSLQDLLS